MEENENKSVYTSPQFDAIEIKDTPKDTSTPMIQMSGSMGGFHIGKLQDEN